jgi:hypothetical protein
MTDQLMIDQIKRCRRIASYLTDPELRHSLEELAEEYEARLPKKHRGFMLRGSEQDS